MSRRLRHVITGIFVAFAASVVIPFQMLTAFAASAKISFSDPSASMGQEFSVSVKISATDGDLGAADVMLTYDPAYIEFVSGNNASGGAGSVRLVGTMDSDSTTVFSYNLKFKAIQAGNSGISVASYEVYDKDTQAVDVTKVGSSTVKVAAPSDFSKEARLSTLKVSPGNLSPEFSPDVTSYTVNVGGDVDRIAVSAAAKDSKAKVVVSGDSNLKQGANNVVCKVTAEDGQTVKSYKLTVNKSATAESSEAQEADAPVETQGAVLSDLKADIDGTEFTIASAFDPAALPQGFSQSSCTYNGNEVMAGTGNGLTLIYLQDNMGTGSFFIYNAESGALSPYVTIDVTASSITVLPVDESVEIPEGFAQTTIQLSGEYKVNGWVWQSDGDQKYCVVYGMNENGEKGLYRYDITEKTFQRYFEDPAIQSKYNEAEVEHLNEEYHKLLKDYNTRFIIMVALAVVCLILLFFIINLFIKRRDKSDSGKDWGEEPSSPPRRRPAEKGGSRGRGELRESRSARQSSGMRQNESIRRDEEMRLREKPLEDGRKNRIDYTIRHEEAYDYEPAGKTAKTGQPRQADNLPGSLKQREFERDERARLARERLERERKEDECRRSNELSGHVGRRPQKSQDGDFEFMDLD